MDSLAVLSLPPPRPSYNSRTISFNGILSLFCNDFWEITEPADSFDLFPKSTACLKFYPRHWSAHFWYSVSFHFWGSLIPPSAVASVMSLTLDLYEAFSFSFSLKIIQFWVHSLTYRPSAPSSCSFSPVRCIC